MAKPGLSAHLSIKMKYLFNAGILSVISVIGCTSDPYNTQAYIDEASGFCRAHSIEYWQEKGILKKLHSADPFEKQRLLANEISSTVQSEEMSKIIIEGQDIRGDDYYVYLQARIPSLTKEAFICEPIEKMYSLDQEIIVEEG